MFTYGVGNILYTGLTLALVPLYLEILSVEDYAILSLFLVTTNIIPIAFSFNISNGIIRAFEDKFSQNDLKVLVSTTLITFFFLGVFFLGISYFLSSQLTGLFYNLEALWLSLATFLYSTTRIFLRVFLGIKQASNQPRSYVLLNVQNVAVLIILNLYLLLFSTGGLMEIIYAYLISGVITFFFGTYMIRDFLKLQFDFSKLRYLLQYGLPLSLANLFSYIINYGNRFFVVNMLTPEDVAVIDLAQKISGLVSLLITSAFLTTFTPFYLKLFNELGGDLKSFSKNILKIINKFTFYYFGFGIFVVVFNELGLLLLSKDEYLAAGIFVPFFILGNYFYVLFMMLTMGTNIRKETRFEFYITAVIMIFNLVFNYLSIKYLELFGVVITQVVINFFSVVLIQLYNSKFFPLDLKFKKVLRMTLLFTALSVLYFLKLGSGLWVDSFIIPVVIIVVFLYLNREFTTDITTYMSNKVRISKLLK